MRNIIDSYAIVILAAGRSERMGTSKQVLQFQSRSLVGLTVEKALAMKSEGIFVVVRSITDPAAREVEQMQVRIVENRSAWEGISSSIRAGLYQAMRTFPQIDGVMFLVCDQPHLSASVLNDLFSHQQEKDCLITCCQYAKSQGTPALFHRSLFKDLLGLRGDQGAKKIFRGNIKSLGEISFELGNIDIDTPADYSALIQNSKHDPGQI